MNKGKKVLEVSHKVAKYLVAKTDDYMIALKFAMKYVWGMVRKGKTRIGQKTIERVVWTLSHPRVERNIDGIPMWIIEKNLSFEQQRAVRCGDPVTKVLKETEKAINVCFETDFGNIYMWCPKSVLVEPIEY